MSAQQAVLEMASEVGFDLVGIAPLTPPPDADRFADWLDRGHHAGMDYLERNRERILDPRRLLPEGRSMLVVGLAHARAAVELEGGGKVARYAAGRDYHNVIGRMLRKLARRLDEAGLGGRRRAVVDAGPLLERSHAERAGLGFASKAANLLHPRFGPWFFLGELLLEIELPPTGPAPHGSCGTCTACIDACPTGAILEPGRVDAGRCISYQTIENRASIPREIRADMRDWAFGCDVCSEVCPWGQAAPDLSERFGTHQVLDGGLVSWLEPREEAARSEWIGGSPLQRPKRAGLARNAAIALGHLPSEEGRRALLQALSFDPSSIVRESAAWALGRAHAQDTGVRAAIGKQLAVEADSPARDGMRKSLDGVP
jgi:epoxyqueuosine reductase